MASRSSHRRRATLLGALATFTVVGIALLTGPLASADSRRPPSEPKPTIVLVHGAWADGSSWAKVTSRLLKAGYDVRVPPNNLRGVASDAADVAQFVDTLPGPVVLVGHSYGGMVITNAGLASEKVKALVYVDALIPDEGDTLVGMTHPPSIFAQPPENVLDFASYSGAPEGALDTYVKSGVFAEAFANEGISTKELAVLAATQRPLSTQVFEEPSGAPAWAKLPSWAVVGTKDRIIPIGDQIAMAQRAGAHVVEVDAPHLAMVTDDRAVAEVIMDAARSN